MYQVSEHYVVLICWSGNRMTVHQTPVVHATRHICTQFELSSMIFSWVMMLICRKKFAKYDRITFLPHPVYYSAPLFSLQLICWSLLMFILYHLLTYDTSHCAYCDSIYVVAELKLKLGCDVYTGWAKKSKRDNFCNNFVNCQPIFIIFGTYTL